MGVVDLAKVPPPHRLLIYADHTAKRPNENKFFDVFSGTWAWSFGLDVTLATFDSRTEAVVPRLEGV
jgi:hypothetical protein